MSPLAELANVVLDGDNILKYRQLINHPQLGPAGNTLSSNEFGRVAQGVGGNRHYSLYQQRRRAKRQSYGCYICPVYVQYSTRKRRENRTRCVAGGDKINYLFDVETPTDDMLLVNKLFNSIISTKGAKFMTTDIKHFYLMTTLKRWGYIRLRLSDIPAEVLFARR